MANQYNPSFSHPSFVRSDYGTEFGAGVNFNPSQLTFNNNFPNRVRGYKHRIYNSYLKSVFTWNDVGVIYAGSSPHISGFYNERSTVPVQDFIWVQILIETNLPVFSFRVDVMADQGVYAQLTDWVPIVNGTTGLITCEIWVGPDKGGGACDLTWRIRIPDYGLDLNYQAFNYTPRADVNEWFPEFYGLEQDWGQTILLAHQAIVSQYFVPSSIPSAESFGQPTVALLSIPQSMSVYGIDSGEAWGNPSILRLESFIFPNSIPSSEAFGSPTLNITTTVQSALPPPSPAKEGDIRITFDVNEQFIDMILADRDVERDDGLETAVLITLLTDKHADLGDPLPDDSGYRGGWFGDSLPVVPDYQMGTKLWLLQRAKTVTEIPAIAKEYLLDGFKWMVEDGIVKSVDVTVERRRDLRTTLAFTLSFVKPEGTTIFYKFYYNWEAQLLRRQ